MGFGSSHDQRCINVHLKEIKDKIKVYSHNLSLEVLSISVTDFQSYKYLKR